MKSIAKFITFIICAIMIGGIVTAGVTGIIEKVDGDNEFIASSGQPALNLDNIEKLTDVEQLGIENNKEGFKNILFMVVNEGEQGENSLTEELEYIAICTYKPQFNQVHITQIPIATYVGISSELASLNDIYKYEKQDGVSETLEYMLECEIDNYVKLSSEYIGKMIDNINGIELSHIENAFLQENKEIYEEGNKVESQFLLEYNAWLKDKIQRTNGTDKEKYIEAREIFVSESMEQVLNITSEKRGVGKLASYYSLYSNSNTDLQRSEMIDFSKVLLNRENTNTYAILGGEFRVQNKDVYFFYTLQDNIELLRVMIEENEQYINRQTYSVYIENCTGRDGAAATLEHKMRRLGYENIEIETGEEFLIDSEVIFSGVSGENEEIILDDLGLQNAVVQNTIGKCNIKIRIGVN